MTLIVVLCGISASMHCTRLNSGSVLCALMLSVYTFITLSILLTTEVAALCFAAYGLSVFKNICRFPCTLQACQQL